METSWFVWLPNHNCSCLFTWAYLQLRWMSLSVSPFPTFALWTFLYKLWPGRDLKNKLLYLSLRCHHVSILAAAQRSSLSWVMSFFPHISSFPSPLTIIHLTLHLSSNLCSHPFDALKPGIPAIFCVTIGCHIIWQVNHLWWASFSSKFRRLWLFPRMDAFTQLMWLNPYLGYRVISLSQINAILTVATSSDSTCF